MIKVSYPLALLCAGLNPLYTMPIDFSHIDNDNCFFVGCQAFAREVRSSLYSQEDSLQSCPMQSEQTDTMRGILEVWVNSRLQERFLHPSCQGWNKAVPCQIPQRDPQHLCCYFLKVLLVEALSYN